jgi:hypothetical protein
VIVAGAAALWLGHREVGRDVDLALAAAARETDGLPVVEIPPPEPVAGRGGRTRLWADTTSATDGGGLGGVMLVATAGGLIEVGAGSARTIGDVLSGLPDHDLTALAARGRQVAVGARSGAVSTLAGDRFRTLRIDGGRHGAILDLAWWGPALYIATASGSVIRLQGDHADLLPPRIQGGVTALVDSSGGLIATGGDGVVYRVAGDALEVLARTDGGPVRLTGAAWVGETLVVGTATGLLRANGHGRLETLRDGLIVTCLLAHRDRLLVGTIDSGVAVLDGASPGDQPLERLLPGRRVDRLRTIDGRPVAFGPDLVAVLGTGGEPRLVELPRGLSSGHVSALAFDDQHRLWVGHFNHGVDVLDDRGSVVRHLPPPELESMSSVNALAFDPRTRTMLVATSHGVLEAGDAEVVTISRDDGLIGDAVTAVLVNDAARIYATSQGITVAPSGADEPRSIYAFHGLPSNRVYALSGSPDRMMVGTLGGLAEVDGTRVGAVRRAGPRGLQANWCSALAQGAEGVYVGTTGGGVDLVTSRSVTRLEAPDGGRFSVSPGGLLLLDDVLLVATLERGLLAYDRREREWLSLPQPMPGAAVTALVADSESLYVGTDRGLMRIDLPALPE